jgi:thioredoxin-dependent peroxiredoxin
MKVIRRFLQCFCIGLFILSMMVSTISPALAMGGVQPPVGESAPFFSLPAQTGEGAVSLTDYLGHWVVLYFYPKDFTPGCTLEAQRFQHDLAQYQALDAQILGVSADSAEVHAEFCDSEQLTFPLLADEDGSVSQAYGSWLGNLSMRHTFIIDPEGTLRQIFLKVPPAVHSAEVLESLRQLQST